MVVLVSLEGGVREPRGDSEAEIVRWGPTPGAHIVLLIRGGAHAEEV